MIIADIETRIQSLTEKMNERLYAEINSITTAESLESLENSFHRQSRELVDLMSALQIQKTIEPDEISDTVKEFVKLLSGRYKNCGWRSVNVRFIGGTLITLKFAYYTRNCDKNKRNKGIYPALCLLSIHDRCTPGLASEVSMLSAALCSFEEAKRMLENRGISMKIKTVRNIVKRFSARARLAQENDYYHSSVMLNLLKIAKLLYLRTEDGFAQTNRGQKQEKGVIVTIPTGKSQGY